MSYLLHLNLGPGRPCPRVRRGLSRDQLSLSLPDTEEDGTKVEWVFLTVSSTTERGTLFTLTGNVGFLRLLPVDDRSTPDVMKTG